MGPFYPCGERGVLKMQSGSEERSVSSGIWRCESFGHLVRWIGYHFAVQLSSNVGVVLCGGNAFNDCPQRNCMIGLTLHNLCCSYCAVADRQHY